MLKTHKKINMGRFKNIIDDLSKFYEDIEVFSKEGRSKTVFFNRGTGFEDSQSYEKGIAIRFWKHDGSGYFLHSSNDDPKELKKVIREKLNKGFYSKGNYPSYGLAEKQAAIRELNLLCHETEDTPLDQLRHFFLESKQYLEEHWKGLIRVNSGELRTGLSSNYLINSRGFEGKYKKSLACMSINFQINSQNQRRERRLFKRIHDFHITFADFSKFNLDLSKAFRHFEQLIEKDTKISPKKMKREVKSNMKVVFSAQTSSLLLKHFFEFLHDAHGSAPTFSEKLTIVDNAKLEGGLGSFPFDGAGFPPKRTVLIKNGKIIHWFENIIRPSYKDYPELGPTNIYIYSGEKSQEEVIGHVARGVFIVSLKAFKNPYEEKVSFLGQGFYIEGGMLSSHAQKFIIITDIKDIFKNILEIADDLQFLPWSGAFGAPSLLVENVSLAPFS